MLKTSKHLILFLFFLCTSLYANDSYDNKIIEDIKITIENAQGESDNTEVVLSKLSSQKGSPFSQAEFDKDLKKLSIDFEKVDSQIEVKNDAVYISIKLWIRPTIAKIEWHGNEKISTKKLQKELGIKPFSVFHKAKFNSALNKVKEYLVKKGFFESTVTYKITPIEHSNEIKIDIYVNENKSGKIKEIKFIGFTNAEESELLKAIQTKKYSILTSWFLDTGIYREEAIDQDKMNIINYLQNKGYADSKVDIEILEDPKSKKIIIQITAHRGILYRFGKVTFEGNSLISDNEIINTFLVHPGDPFSPDKIRETAQAIKDIYGAKGYIDANVYYDTYLQQEEPIYNIDFYIEEGTECKIGLIKIYGNKSTKAKVILRESLLVPGKTFDNRKLKATQMRLESIGYFKNVNVYAVQSSDPSLGDNYRDVHIEVDEQSTGNVSFSGNLSSSDGGTGTIDLTENNFDHGGLFKLFKYGPAALRGNGEYFQAKTSIGKKQYNYSLSWMTPYFMDSLWKAGFEFSGTSSSLQSKDYKIKTLGGAVFATYPLTSFWSVGSRYRVRNSDNHVKNVNLSNEEQKKIKKDSEGIISAQALLLSYNSTDNSYKPRRGLKSSFEAEFVGIGGHYTFWKFAYTNTYYYPIWSKGTMKYRFNLNFIDPLTSKRKKWIDNVPLSERFFLGGVKTVRGYKEYIIGPRQPGKPDDPLGGITSALYSIEYNQEIIRPLLDVFVFADGGQVAFNKYHLVAPRVSAGVGLRLEIMNKVPIIVGWGRAINPKRGHKDRQAIFFDMGAQF